MLENTQSKRRTIIFDGDDTLWATQELYDDAKARFYDLLSHEGYGTDEVAAAFAQIDVANVARLGFSRERFPRSMRETYERFCEQSRQKPKPSIVSQSEAIGAAVFDAEPVVRIDAVSTLETLRERYRLVLFTAGDDAVQRRRILQTGLRTYFEAIHITSQKSRDSWGELLVTETPHGKPTWSVGNSVKSDINPALSYGLQCVVIAGRSWDYERAALAVGEDGERVWRADTLTQVTRTILQVDSDERGRPLNATVDALRELRSRVERVFARDTSLPGSVANTPSTGHCAVVAAIVRQRFGGQLLCTAVEGEPHWFNRLYLDEATIDVDLTGDQFGRPALQVARKGELYDAALVRDTRDLRPETLERALLLATRANLGDVASGVAELLASTR
jgi:putative hydrolase of the HAD superfamily